MKRQTNRRQDARTPQFALYPMIARALFLAAAMSLSTGCCARPDPDPFSLVAKQLDFVESHVRTQGYVTASGVLLLRNEGQFRVDLDRPVKEYIDAARVGTQAAARSAEERTRESRDTFRLTVPIDRLLTGLGALDLELPEMDAEKGDASDAMRTATTPEAAATLSPLLPIGPLPAGLSERQALTLGLNDKVTERLLRLLLDPGASISDDEAIYLALLQVSVNPGTLTRRDHVAELILTAYYAREEECQPNGFRSSRTVDLSGPRIVSVYPSIDAQVIDQRRSVRDESKRVLELASILSALGAKAESEALRREAERLENDFVTRTPMPLVSAFSAGAAFGYQVMPSIQAAALTSGRGGHVHTREMYPTTFPALVLVIFNRDEYEGKKKKEPWTHLELMVSSRWFPVTGGGAGEGRAESHRLEVAKALDQALAGMGDIPLKVRSSFSAQELVRRFESLSIAGLGRTWYMPLKLYKATDTPKPAAELVVSDVFPRQGWANADTMFAIHGSGFTAGGRPNVSAVTVGGVQCQFTIVDAGVLLAIAPAKAFLGADGKPIEASQYISVIGKNGVVEKREAPIVFNLIRSEAPARPGIKLARNASDGLVTQITIESSPDLDARTLLDALRDIVRRERVSADVSVTFDVEAKQSTPQ